MTATESPSVLVLGEIDIWDAASQAEKNCLVILGAYLELGVERLVLLKEEPKNQKHLDWVDQFIIEFPWYGEETENEVLEEIMELVERLEQFPTQHIHIATAGLQEVATHIDSDKSVSSTSMIKAFQRGVTSYLPTISPRKI